jgi:hypothetical protein
MTSELLTGFELNTRAGVFRLGIPLRTSDDSAVYQTAFGDPGQPGWIELRRADAPDAEEILTSWRGALALAHPHLLRMYAAGTFELEGVPVIYRVAESADESLAGVLAERTLSEHETREMLEPALLALGYLHKRGCVHGGLEPSSIMAAGDTLKLSIDRMAVAGRHGPSEDMKALGEVLTQALTGQTASDAPQVTGEPWRELVQHLLDPDPGRRWTADQSLAYLKPPRKAIPEEPVVAPETRARDYRKWIAGAIAALLLIVAGVAMTRKTEPAIPVPAPPVAVVSAPAPLPEAPVPQVPAKVPEAALLNPPSPAPAAGRAIAPTGDRRADGWAVVVAAYGIRQPAEKRVRELEKKWPAFTFKVLEPASEKARYLIVIGSNLPEDRAEALHKRAIASGLARDAYIKRFAAEPK